MCTILKQKNVFKYQQKYSNILLTVLLFFAIFFVPIATSQATNSAGLASQINTFEHGGIGNLSATQTGNIVNVTGSVTDAKKTLYLYIASDVKIRWEADYQDDISNENQFSLFLYGGEFEFVSGSIIRNSMIGSAIFTKNCKLTISGGFISTNDSSIPIYAENSTIIMTDGKIESSGYSAISTAAGAIVSILGGTVSSLNGFAFRVADDDCAIGYMPNVLQDEDNYYYDESGFIVMVTATEPLPQDYINTNEDFELLNEKVGTTAKWINNNNRADIEISFGSSTLTIPMGLEISNLTGTLDNQNIYISPPMTNQTPQTIISGTEFTGVIKWIKNSDASEHSGSNPFDNDEIYKAMVTLTAESGWQWLSANPAISVNGQPVICNVNNNILTFDFVFPKTTNKKVSIGVQNGFLTAGIAGLVSFPVKTMNFPDDTYNISLSDNAPTGITVTAGSTININNNTGTLSVNMETTTPADRKSVV
jgi:hypothetical protein